MAKQSMREKTAGTLTFFFPYKRDMGTPPEVTVMVRRTGEEEWRAGFSVCSREDMFCRRVGRVIAFQRLEGHPFPGPRTIVSKKPLDLLIAIAMRCAKINKRRGSTVAPNTIEQLSDIVERLEGMRVE